MIPKSSFRIYALVLGQVLIPGEFLNCKVLKMDFDEQETRKFKPIQGKFIEKAYETYSTFLPYIDPLKIKSKYTLSYDSNEKDIKSALGDASRNIDKACRYLSLGQVLDIKADKGRVTSFEPYLYQIVKIYKLSEAGKEVEVEFEITSNSYYLPLRPETNHWRDASTGESLSEVSLFHDSTFERSLKYLYRSSIGHRILDSPEKIALDHFKSMEIIINSFFGKKNQDSFVEKLKKVKEILDLSNDEQKRIKDLWDERSKYGDIAHPSKFDQVERYPDQFPLPRVLEYTGLADSIACKLLLKYLDYKKKLYRVDIEQVGDAAHLENQLAVCNWEWENNHYVYFTNEDDRSEIKKNVCKALVEDLRIDSSNILTYELKREMEKLYAKIRIK